MSTELSTTSIRERIRERIINEFSTLITDEEWDALISRTLSDLTMDKSDGYGKTLRAPIRDIIHEELVSIATKQIQRRSNRIEAAQLRDIVDKTVTPHVLMELCKLLISSSLTAAINNNAVNLIQDAMQEVRISDCPACDYGRLVGFPGQQATCGTCRTTGFVSY